MAKRLHKTNNHKRGQQTLAGDKDLPLTGFLQVQVPDVTSIKFVYSDFRSITSSASQGEYVYRLNSVFDPDSTGVGGQPDGFDLWKTLYSQYRVVACDVEVQCVGFSGIGFVAMGPSPNSTSFTSAEEIAGLRKSKGGIFTLGQGAVTKLHRMYRISDLNGISDESLLANDSFAATTTSNPSRMFYLHIGTETAGASDVAYVWVKLTYFTRLENAADTLDSVSRHRRMIAFAAQGQPPNALPSQKTPPVEGVGKRDVHVTPGSNTPGSSDAADLARLALPTRSGVSSFASLAASLQSASTQLAALAVTGE